MKKSHNDYCTECGAPVVADRRSHHYAESGLSNVILEDVPVADCANCGNSDITVPGLAKLHQAIAQALASSPARLTGEQLRFLRKHLGLTGDELGRYLHTDRSKISKWETGEHPIGPQTDRLIRLLVAALDPSLRDAVSEIAEHLPAILDKSGLSYELRVNAHTLRSQFAPITKAA